MLLQSLYAKLTRAHQPWEKGLEELNFDAVYVSLASDRFRSTTPGTGRDNPKRVVRLAEIQNEAVRADHGSGAVPRYW